MSIRRHVKQGNGAKNIRDSHVIESREQPGTTRLVLVLVLVIFTIMLASCGERKLVPVEDSPSTIVPDEQEAENPNENTAAEQSPQFELVTVGPQSESTPLLDGFDYIDRSIICEIRYATSYNFIGTPIDGYEKPVGILSNEANAALLVASKSAQEQGYRIKVFDAYRPYRAHEHFVRWGGDQNDMFMKGEFYPNVDKSQLFNGYIAYNGDPHSSGSTVDLTLVDAVSGRELDMGSQYDLLDPISNYHSNSITSEQYANRTALRNIMLAAGFIPYDGEWWDFTLANEPYPFTYFDFPVA